MRIIYWIKEFPYRLKRSIRWFFFMFVNEEWDYIYLLKVWRFRLQDLSKFWNSERHQSIYDYISDQDEVVKSINDCIEILDKLIEDNYAYNGSGINKNLDRDENKLFSIIKNNYKNWWN